MREIKPGEGFWDSLSEGKGVAEADAESLAPMAVTEEEERLEGRAPT